MIKNLLDNIGDTSLIQLKKIGDGRIFVKLEKTCPLTIFHKYCLIPSHIYIKFVLQKYLTISENYDTI